MSRIDAALGKSIAAVCRWSVRNAKVIVVLYVAVTLAFGYGLTMVQVRSTDYDLMPDDHPSAVANYKALDKIPGFRNADTLWIEVSHPEQGEHITDEAAIRGAEEVADFIQAKVPGMKYVISLSYLVKLVNYTASGVPDPVTAIAPEIPGLPPIPRQVPRALQEPDGKAFSLPPDSLTFQRDYSILNAASNATIQAQTNENYTGAIVVFIYDVNLTRAGPSAVVPVATEFVHATEAWRDQGCPNMKTHSALVKTDPVFNCKHTYILGQSINGHMTELAQNDFMFFGPIVFVATFLVLVLAFTDIPSMLIAMLSFTIGLIWTYGLMGYLHIPLTFFGLLIVPITMGVGKEYAIYVTNQFIEYTAAGKPRDEVWTMVGRRAGAALAVASVTSISGLVAMEYAGFHIMSDLATLTMFSFASLFLLSITFIPAMQSIRKGKAKTKPFKPSRLMGGVAKGVVKYRIGVIVVTLLLTAALYVESREIKEYFGISGGFRQGDYLEESYQWYNNALGGSGTELVVFEGNISDWKTLQFIDALDHKIVADKELVPKASNVNSLMLSLRTYYDLRNGLLNPAILTEKAKQDPNANIPHDAKVVAADIKSMYASTEWAPLVAIFVSPDSDYAVTHFFYKIEKEDYDGLKHDWDKLNADAETDIVPANERTIERPDTVKSVNLVGTQDTFYLFVEYGLPWLDYVTIAATVLTLIISVIVFGRVRDVLAVMVPMTVAAIWWAGLLPLFHIEKSMTLMLPTVMLISVGSDYAIQYVWNYREMGDMEEVYRTTGKANLYVVIATCVAFLLFVPMKLVLSSQGALAAALAIGTIFVSTTLLVPIFYAEKKPVVALKDEKAEEAQTVQLRP